MNSFGFSKNIDVSKINTVYTEGSLEGKLEKSHSNEKNPRDWINWITIFFHMTIIIWILWGFFPHYPIMGSYHHVGWKCLCEICFKLTIGVFIHCLITDALKIKAHPFTSVAYIQIHKKKPIIFLMAKNILRHNNHVIRWSSRAATCIWGYYLARSHLITPDWLQSGTEVNRVFEF